MGSLGEASGARTPTPGRGGSLDRNAHFEVLTILVLPVYPSGHCLIFTGIPTAAWGR